MPIPAAKGCEPGHTSPARITLFKDWTRLTTDEQGEAHEGPLQGLYCAETQLLALYRFYLNGKRPVHRFSVQTSENQWSSVCVLPECMEQGNLPEGHVPRGSLELRILRTIDRGWAETLLIGNNSNGARTIKLKILLSCPISDREYREEHKEEKGGARKGVKPIVTKEANRMVLRFARRFGIRARTPRQELDRVTGLPRIYQDGEPVIRALNLSVGVSGFQPRAILKVRGRSTAEITLVAVVQARSTGQLELKFEPEVDGVSLSGPDHAAIEPKPHVCLVSEAKNGDIFTGSPAFNDILARAESDLDSLKLHVFGGDSPEVLFNAGIPRYTGIFGRDNLTVAIQSALLTPRNLESVVNRLSAYQGVRFDPWREEEPGRMPHERRLSPLAALGKSNRSLYFGDVASTPLWITALKKYRDWTGDMNLVTRHQDTLEACCAWMARRLREGRGFVFYAPSDPKSAESNRNQAWKDSGDGIVDEVGRIRNPPLAIAEIQGYVFPRFA